MKLGQTTQEDSLDFGAVEKGTWKKWDLEFTGRLAANRGLEPELLRLNLRLETLNRSEVPMNGLQFTFESDPVQMNRTLSRSGSSEMGHDLAG
jgi:hypothetical protein